MVDYHKNLVNALKEVLPTHYEMVLTSGTATPCISYMELSNSATINGDTLGYSRLVYQIKVWGNKIEDLQNYAMQIDDKLRPLGFARTATNEVYDPQSTMMQKIMTYEALAWESFK